MGAEIKKEIQLEIAHVLFIDIVGYSKLSINEQHAAVEELNQLEFFDATEPPNQQGLRNLTVTGPDHPYSENFWKPGHIIGYEHTFIAALGDFLGVQPIKPGREGQILEQGQIVVQERLVQQDAESKAGRANVPPKPLPQDADLACTGSDQAGKQS